MHAKEYEQGVRIVRVMSPAVVVIVFGWLAPWALAQVTAGSLSHWSAGISECLALVGALAGLVRAERGLEAISAYVALGLWLCGLFVVFVRYWGG